MSSAYSLLKLLFQSNQLDADPKSLYICTYVKKTSVNVYPRTLFLYRANVVIKYTEKLNAFHFLDCKHTFFKLN